MRRCSNHWPTRHRYVIYYMTEFLLHLTVLGKTCFLIALAFVYLTERKEFFMYINKRLHAFVANTEGELEVWVCKSVPSSLAEFDTRPILIDMDMSAKSPPEQLTSWNHFVIQASSPNSDRYKIWMKQLLGCMLIMDPWTVEELEKGFVLHFCPVSN